MVIGCIFWHLENSKVTTEMYKPSYYKWENNVFFINIKWQKKFVRNDIWHAVYRKLKSYLSPIKFDLLIWKIFPYNRTITWWNLMNIGINELKLMSNCWHQGHGDQTGAVTHDLPQLRLACFTTNVVNLRKKNYFIYKTVTILQSLYLNGFQIYILKET